MNAAALVLEFLEAVLLHERQEALYLRQVYAADIRVRL
jgi:hypothetical protein